MQQRAVPPWQLAGANDVVRGGGLRAVQGLGEVALEIYRNGATVTYFGILSKLTFVF